jgi:hypothetical protein
MSSNLRLVRPFIATAFILILSMLAFADTVRLKDGSIIKGKIVSFDAGKFVVVMGEGSRRRELSFTAAEVESIRFDDPSGAPSLANSTRAASYEPTPKSEPAAPTTIKVGDPDPPTASIDKMKPIEWRVKVLADNTGNGWTNTGFVVKKGQRVRIEGDGKVSLGRNQTSSPSGVPAVEDQQKLLKNVATGALIAVIGDDNNEFIYIGAEREFTATRDGALFLGINEGYLDDNSGSYTVKVVIIPDGR